MVVAARLRQLQARVRALGVDAVVLVHGLDAAFDAANAAALHWLCGGTPPEAAVVVVEPAAVHCLLDPPGRAALGPTLACGRAPRSSGWLANQGLRHAWQTNSAFPGAQIYSRDAAAYADSDAVEDFRVRTFVEILKPYHAVRAVNERLCAPLQQAQLFGVKMRGRGVISGYSHRPLYVFLLWRPQVAMCLAGESVLRSAELWPLVQAFALEEYSGRGFLSLAMKVVDASPTMTALYRALDSHNLKWVRALWTSPLGGGG
jgi:hypothetical protein